MVNIDWEVWKDIPWYEGLYKVSNMGRVLSLKRKNHIILSPREKGKNSYVSVSLSKDLVEKNILIHRLVASCFLGLDLFWFTDPKNSICVCHKDDNPANNKADNLFLGTHKDNSLDRENKWRNWMKGKFWSEHNLSKKVYQMKDGEIINTYGSTCEAERMTWINSRHISRCALRKKMLAWWFSWSYTT